MDGRSAMKKIKNIYAIMLLFSAFDISAANKTADIDQAIEQFIGTISTKSLRASPDGDLKGCGINFAAIGRDFSTKNGALFKAIGSYYFRNVAGKPEFWLKLGIFDVDPKNPAVANIATISNAHIASEKRESLKHRLKFNGDTPGFKIYSFDATKDSADIWLDFLNTGKLKIGFNRSPEQQDVVFTVDGTVSESSVIDEKFIRHFSRENLADIEACSALLAKTFN